MIGDPVELRRYARTATEGDKFMSPDGKVHEYHGTHGDAVMVLVRGFGVRVPVLEPWSGHVTVRPVPRHYRVNPGGRPHRQDKIHHKSKRSVA